MKNKVAFFSFVVVIIISMTIGTYFFVKNQRVKNVFDEIYYAWKEYSYLYPFTRTTETRIGNIEEVNKLSEELIQGAKDTCGPLLSYNKEYLRNNTGVLINLENDRKGYYLVFSIIDSENEILTLTYVYNHNTKTLYIEPISVFSKALGNNENAIYGEHYSESEEIEKFIEINNITYEEVEEFKQYALYEVIIKSWIDGNGEKSKFTQENPGHFVIDDQSYSQIDISIMN